MSEQNAQVERLTLAKAITRGLDDVMADNRKVVLIGEISANSAAYTA